MEWTTEQVLALAPDASTVKAGQGLATPIKWASWGCDETTCWGECKGSGQKPYQVEIDLGEPVFHCSCPSHKFPCKHGVGLLLLWVNQRPTFTQHTPPQWVIDWVASRAKRAQDRANRAANKEQRGGEVADPAAQAKRSAQRQVRIADGLQELDLWLRDLIRNGLASIQNQGYAFWEAPATRMVDAQAPGLATRLRQMAGIAATGGRWPERLLDQIARLHLVIEGYQHFESLPPGTQADIQTVLGLTPKQDDLFGEPAIRDRWLILGRRIEQADRVQTQRTWLVGQNSQRCAVILDSAYGTQSLDTSLIPNTCLDAELIFYPSAYPLRAFVKQRSGVSDLPDLAPHFTSIAAMMASYAAGLACNPWIEQFPALLRDVIPVQRSDSQGDHWLVRDSAGNVLPLAASVSSEKFWSLVAISGGRPIHLLSEFDGERLTPVSIWAEQRFIGL